MGTYTGAWKARAVSPYYEPEEPVKHVSDPAHSQTNTLDPRRVDWQAPPLQDNGYTPGGQYPGSEWVIGSTAGPIDQTPEDHSTPNYGTDPHQVDYGGVAVTVKGDAVLGYPGQRDEALRYEDNGPIPTNVVAVQRGLNSYDQNNPQGFRRGFVDWWRSNRPSRMVDRQHVGRPVWPNTATFPTDVPAPVDQWSNTTSPFNSFARTVLNTWMRPQARREPGGIDDGTGGDGAGAVLSQTPVASWVVG